METREGWGGPAEELAEDLRAKAHELWEKQIRGSDRGLLRPGDTLVGEIPFGNSMSFTIVRKQPPAGYIFQIWLTGPDGCRFPASRATRIPLASLASVAGLLSKALDLELTELRRLGRRSL